MTSVVSSLGLSTLSITRSAEPDASAAGDIPRELTFLMIKRIDPRLPNTWGHWWIEVDDRESFGWWPTPCPMGWRGAVMGCGGCLNGMDTADGGTATRDAYHGDDPDHCFHPTLVVDKSDDEVRDQIRSFAQSYVGGFRWQWWWLREPAENCRTFQKQMFEAVGLREEPQYLYTQGSGCPFMYPFRRARWRVLDLLRRGAGRFAWIDSRSARPLRGTPNPESESFRTR